MNMDDDSSEDDELEKTTTSMLQMEYQAELMDDLNMKMSNGLRKGSSNASLPKHSSQGSLALETIEVQPQLS